MHALCLWIAKYRYRTAEEEKDEEHEENSDSVRASRNRRSQGIGTPIYYDFGSKRVKYRFTMQRYF